MQRLPLKYLHLELFNEEKNTSEFVEVAIPKGQEIFVEVKE